MKITINEKQQNKLIKEYLDKEYGMPLKKYFDDHCYNSEFILRRYFPLFSLFLKKNGYDEEYYAPFEVKDNKDPNIDKLITFIDPSQVDEFYMWLWKHREFARHDPEASFFLTDPRLVKNRWVIHFTNKSSALDICKNGFKLGVPKDKINQLAYTAKVKEKTPDGYVYAYDVDKIYNGNLSMIMLENAPAAVMCQVNGVEVHHGTDREDQIIFHPSTVKNMVLLFKTDDVNGGWQVAKNTFRQEDFKDLHEKCKSLISPSEFNSLDGVIEWVKNNIFQYRRIICWEKQKIEENREVLQEDVLATFDSPHIEILRRLGWTEDELKIKSNKNTRGLDKKDAYANSRYLKKECKVKLKLNDIDTHSYASIRVANHPCHAENITSALTEHPNAKWMVSFAIGTDKPSVSIIKYPQSFYIIEFNISVRETTSEKRNSIIARTTRFIKEILKNGYSLGNDTLEGYQISFISTNNENKALLNSIKDNEIFPDLDLIEIAKKCKIIIPKIKTQGVKKHKLPTDLNADFLFDLAMDKSSKEIEHDTIYQFFVPSENHGNVLTQFNVDTNEYRFKDFNGKWSEAFMALSENKICVNNNRKRMRKINISPNQEQILIKENIKIHKGENGRKYSTQGKWDKEIECPHCGKKAYFSMSISDGEKGRGRIKVTDEDGKEKDSEVQTIALYYCPHCYKFIARNNMA